jgi:hypothetical protein
VCFSGERRCNSNGAADPKGAILGCMSLLLFLQGVFLAHEPRERTRKMAHRLQAIRSYGPRIIDMQPAFTADQIVEMTVDATNQSRSSVISLLAELDRVIELDLDSSPPIHIHTTNCILQCLAKPHSNHSLTYFLPISNFCMIY